jgi:RNA polymerase sigma-70 factor (ECF subfamily)
MGEAFQKPGAPSEEDASLIKSFQAGRKAAFDELVLKHQSRIFNLCYWYLGDEQEANDSAQETFVKAYRSLRSFRFESALSTWLYRIAVNTCKNKLKSSSYRHRAKAVPIGNPGERGDGSAVLDIQDAKPSPLKVLEKKERIRLIKAAIDSLALEHKEVVSLRDIQGLAYEDIAQITGLNLGTVKSRLARARLELREKLRDVI